MMISPSYCEICIASVDSRPTLYRGPIKMDVNVLD